LKTIASIHTSPITEMASDAMTGMPSRRNSIISKVATVAERIAGPAYSPEAKTCSRENRTMKRSAAKPRRALASEPSFGHPL
jgi:hypothetical protein